MTSLPLALVQNPARFEAARETLFESTRFATSPTLRINHATFRGCRGADKVLEGVVDDRAPEEGLAARLRRSPSIYNVYLQKRKDRLTNKEILF